MKTIKELEAEEERPDFNPMRYGYKLALQDVLGLIDELDNGMDTNGNKVDRCLQAEELNARITG